MNGAGKSSIGGAMVRQRGGHYFNPDEADIRRRWEASRQNLVLLMPKLERLYLYDNSQEAAPRRGEPPKPRLLLEMRGGRIARPLDLAAIPAWAKPIVARALQLERAR